MDQLAELFNESFQNDYIRIGLTIITSVLAGYTLRPLPKNLDNLLTQSYMFKFIVLTLVGLLSIGKVNENNMFLVIIMVAVVLAIFEYFRQNDKDSRV